MAESSANEDKPRRLYFETYLQLLRNSVGTEMFRNFYIRTADGHERDALSDGSDSCAFYVSSVLTIFRKLSCAHGTVKSTVEDLVHSGWKPADSSTTQAGDVIVWETMELAGGQYKHIGFSIGDDRAVSTSWTEKRVVEHDARFGGTRAIEQVFRLLNWE